jgi:hypothetical protein
MAAPLAPGAVAGGRDPRGSRVVIIRRSAETLLERRRSGSVAPTAAYVLGLIEGEAEEPAVRGLETPRFS